MDVKSINKPLVSVLMPSYNDKPEWIAKAIESMLNQTYKPIEIIIVDDSTDEDTIAVIDKYVNQNDNLTVLRNPNRSRGLCVAQNEGLSYCHGEFIARMDSDDISIPDRVEKQMAAFRDDIAVVGGQALLIDEEDNYIKDGIWCSLDFEGFQESLRCGVAEVYHPSALIRKSVLDEIGGYDVHFKCAEDFNLYSRISQKYSIINIPDIVLRYRIHGDNAHIKHALLQTKLVSVSQMVNVLFLSRCLTDEEFEKISDIVDRHFISKLFVIFEHTPYLVKGLLCHLNVIKLLRYCLWKSFAYHRKKYMKIINENS